MSIAEYPRAAVEPIPARLRIQRLHALAKLIREGEVAAWNPEFLEATGLELLDLHQRCINLEIQAALADYDDDDTAEVTLHLIDGTTVTGEITGHGTHMDTGLQDLTIDDSEQEHELMYTHIDRVEEA